MLFGSSRKQKNVRAERCHSSRKEDGGKKVDEEKQRDGKSKVITVDGQAGA